MNARLGLGLAIGLAVLHAFLACVLAQITPYRQAGVLLGQRDPTTGRPAAAQDIGAPDERQHANYVQHLLAGKGFPVLGDPDENGYENYQAHQPPLYYLLGVSWSRITGADPEDPQKGRPLRYLNCLIGLGGVLGVYFLGLWAFRKPEIGVLAAAFTALLPMNLALSGAVSNDPLLIALCTWVLAVCALAVREGWTWKRAVLAAVLTGLALLTKTTAVALLPALLLAALIPQTKKPSLAMAGATALIALLIAAPWLIRNQRLYGDPLALSAFQKAFTGNPTPDTFIQPLEQLGESPTEAKWTYWSEGVAWWTTRSFLGVFGYMDIWLSENGRSDTFPSAFTSKPAQPSLVYRLFEAFMALAFIGWLLATFSPESRDARSVQVLNVTFAVIIVALFIRFNMQYFQGQARYLFPAIGPISLGIGLGAFRLCKSKWMPALAILIVLPAAVDALALSRLPGEFAARTVVVSQAVPSSISARAMLQWARPVAGYSLTF